MPETCRAELIDRLKIAAVRLSDQELETLCDMAENIDLFQMTGETPLEAR